MIHAQACRDSLQTSLEFAGTPVAVNLRSSRSVPIQPYEQRFNVFAVTSNQMSGIFNLPDSPSRVYESLMPGEIYRRQCPGRGMEVVRVVVDMPDWNKELDETNNELRKTLH